ncbi:MAG TPA: class I tRNA ligase family protein [Candidatus Paceibacterota bacterium]
MEKYDHQKIEKKWQLRWEELRPNDVTEDSSKPKQYILIEFPYPSGEGLHTGHVRSYTALDIVARKRRAEGFNVLYPIGWDAFGLPAENYALKTGTAPQATTQKSIDTFRRQLKAMGFSFDWHREVNTTDPTYYKWTQWIFLQLYKHGLAYKAKMPINWCPKDKIGLANEEVVDGKCERCGTPVEKREKEQWMLAITKYADRLDKDLNRVNYLERIKTQQRNWIGRSEGAEIDFDISKSGDKIKVFTTRPDTLFGATYLVLAPEHPLLFSLKDKVSNWAEVGNYIASAKQKNDIERTAEGKEKTGVKLEGVSAVHPATKEEIPIFVADYVLVHYGTGAIMAVPAHDERDFEFAEKFNLPVRQVIQPVFGIENRRSDAEARETITAIAKRKDGKILILKWKKQPWITAPIGGIDAGETPAEAAERELLEETGYRGKAVMVSPITIESHFFAEHKKVWRARYDHPVLLEVVDEQLPKPISPEEDALHEIKWMTYEEALQAVSFKNNRLALELVLQKPHAYEGVPYAEAEEVINSGTFNGLSSEEAKEKITEAFGIKKVTYKLRDWVFSRQRYWGEPIPMIHCEKDGWVPVSEEQLPVELPVVEKYQPTDTGESPLAGITEWVNVECPKCGGAAKRETDVMPNWAGSSWYYLRYSDPSNAETFASEKKLKYWLPVDWYNGGMEHTTLHLLYSRFWHKFLFDIGAVPTEEPYAKRTSHGLVLASDGQKMSKSVGNVVNPDELIEKFGADTLRVYEMFMGPFDQPVIWSTENMTGSRRFLERVSRLGDKLAEVRAPDSLETLLHQTIQKVSDDIENMKFNTAISQLMILQNECETLQSIPQPLYLTLLRLLAPFAPHLSEEIWESLGQPGSIHESPWPKADERKLISETALFIIQVNGKVRGQIEAPRDTGKEELQKLALSMPAVAKWVEGKNIAQIVHIPGRLLNIVAQG